MADVPEHRNYVGGMWDEIGPCQFDFLVAQGLMPEHCLLDFGCGSLRAGRFFISYLNPENYIGFDHHQWLIDEGLKSEVPISVREARHPQFIVNDNLDLSDCRKEPDYVLLHSIFTHMTVEDIGRTLASLHQFSHALVFASFNVESDEQNPQESGDHNTFSYPIEQMESLARNTGWKSRFLGNFHHPRGQQMMKFWQEKG